MRFQIVGRAGAGWVLATLVYGITSAASQTAPSTLPRTSGQDVLVVALGASPSTNELRTLRLSALLSGRAQVAGSTIRDVQMEIISKTVSFGPVLVLAPDEQARSTFHATCAAYELCEHIAAGRVRVAIVPHDTVWIRDYGPFVHTDSRGDIKVTDAIYYDIRQDIARGNTLRRVNLRRRLLVEELLQQDGLNLGDSTSDRRALELWREYAAVLHDETQQGQRLQDDQAPFEIVQAAFVESARRPDLVSPAPVFVDGGNILKLDDGATCLTTRDIFVRNRGKEAELAAALKDRYECDSPIYLEALPGPVIEHVDMFLLPVRGKTVLLSDFGLHQPHIERGWSRMSEVERELTFQASLAMDRNEALLRARGFNVILVPALPPRRSSDGDLFYPTQLNGVVRTGGDGHVQVLVPTFEEAPQDVQNAALGAIREAFGPGADVVAVEATVAAEAQGAVHCLTITLPFAVSVFRDGQDVRQRQIWALRDLLEKSLIKVARPTLQGRWTARTWSGEGGLDAELVFDESDLRIEVDGSSVVAQYTVVKEDSYRWPFELTLDNGRRKARGRLDWLTDQSFRFVLRGMDPFVVTRLIRPEDVSPGDRTIELGTERDGTLSLEDTSDAQGALMQAWRFAGQAGQLITVSASSDEFDAEVYVVGPGLDEPVHDDDSGDGLTGARAVLEIPETGEYRIIVKTFGASNGGAFTLGVDSEARASLGALPAVTRALPIGSPQEGMLADGTDVDDAGQPQAWSLEPCTGRTIRIELISDEFDAFLTVSRPDSLERLTNDDSGDSLNSRIELTCAEAAAYTIVVSSAMGRENGRYTLSAVQVER